MGKNRLSRIAADRVVGASLVVIFLLIVVLFGLKCLEVWFESSASEQSLSILGRALQRRFDDLLLWSYFIVLCLGSSVFAALRMPDVKPVRPIGRQLGLLWICLTLCQFFTYFWSQGNPFDPGTFFWTGEAIQVHRDAIANIQWAEGVVDLVLIAAMQTVIVMSLRVCGMTRDTKLSDKARLGLALFIALGLAGGVALAVAYGKLYGPTLPSHEKSPPDVLAAVIALRIWPLAIVGLVLVYSILTEFPSQLAELLRSHIGK